jgi:tRNA modification GTPase
LAGGGTIVAPATAPGRAGSGGIRVSGPDAAELCRRLGGKAVPTPGRATLRRLRDPVDGEPLDRAVLLWHAAPASYTGEDLLEIQHHGGQAVAAALLRACLAVPGVRLADPGEFTRRAFLNGKLDLAEAEAIADLVDATTRAQARQALRQLDGELGRQAEAWREAILAALSRLEAEIDFGADQDVPAGQPEIVAAMLAPTIGALRQALRDAGRGQRLREGITVAVIGPPNAGKSTLVNLLARREVAIVTAIAGTTRDVLEVPLDLGGLPVTLLDTAGLRETTDPIEAVGVERANARAPAADLRLLVLDATQPEESRDVTLESLDLIVWNKADLAAVPPDSGAPALSCRTGAGVDALLSALRDRAARLGGDGGAALVTRERHRAAVIEAEAALGRFVGAGGRLEVALLAEELRLAAQAVGRITGRMGAEEVLDRIFLGFCIGK